MLFSGSVWLFNCWARVHWTSLNSYLIRGHRLRMVKGSCQGSLAFEWPSSGCFPLAGVNESEPLANAILTGKEDRESLWPNQSASSRETDCQEFLFLRPDVKGKPQISGISLNVRITPSSCHLQRGGETQLHWLSLVPWLLPTPVNRADALKRDLFLLLRGLQTGSIHTEGKRTFSGSIHLCHCHSYTSSN